MKVIYVCEICEGRHATPEKALECEAKGHNPLYELEQKAIYMGAIVTISKRSICTFTHIFIYMFHMLPEDNPGKTLWACGWKNEDELQKISLVA